MLDKFFWISYASSRPDWFLQNFFLKNTLIVMSLIFAILLLVAWLNRHELSIPKLEKRTLALLLLVFVLGFFYRNSFYHYGMHSDGFIYIESARFMYEKGLFVKACQVGNIDSCLLYSQVLFPPGYPALISFTYFLTGVNSLNALVISGFLGAFTVLLVFFIARKLFKSDWVGLLSALTFALFPLDLVFANTGNVRPTGNFFAALAILLLLIALEKRKKKTWMLALMALSVSIYMHHQYTALALPFIVGFLLFTKKPFKELKKMWPALGLFALTQVPMQYWLWLSGWRGENIISFKAIVPSLNSLNFVIFNPPQSAYFLEMLNVKFLIHPLVLLAGIIGMLLAFKKEKRKEILFLVSIVLTIILSCLLYSYCSTGICLDVIRFIKTAVLPFSMLAGYAFSIAIKKAKKFETIAFIALMVFLIASSFLPWQPGLFLDYRTKYPEENALYFNAVKNTPNNCTIITPTFLIATSDALPKNSRKTISLWEFYDYLMPFIEKEINDSKCVYLIKSNSSFEQNPVLQLFIASHKFEKIRVLSNKQTTLEIYKMEK